MSIIIQYYADSLGLPRPGTVDLQQRYIYLLEEWLRTRGEREIFIINRARGGGTITQLFETFKEDEGYVTGEKDMLILHEGICDCAPRPVSKSIRRIISRLPGFIRTKIIHWLHDNRARLLRNGFVNYLVEKPVYRQTLTEWLVQALKSFKVIYIFTIADTNDATEAHSPGFRKSIAAYNDIIKQVAGELNDARIHVIDIHAILRDSGRPYDELIVADDGHHITPAAHQLYFEEIAKLETHRIAECLNGKL